MNIYHELKVSYIIRHVIIKHALVKELLYFFEIPLVDPLTLIIILSLFNLYINITSQSSLQLLLCYYLFFYL
jgi:hypothetical protein